MYEWAGRKRSVNLSKDGFPFAPAAQIPSLLEQFDRQCLARRTPCAGMGREEAVAAIAEAHVELVLIHPFREGNGRIARLLADVMANQAGLGLLDYTPWGGIGCAISPQSRKGSVGAMDRWRNWSGEP